jgi:hypothetical protein
MVAVGENHVIAVTSGLALPTRHVLAKLLN